MPGRARSLPLSHVLKQYQLKPERCLLARWLFLCRPGGHTCRYGVFLALVPNGPAGFRRRVGKRQKRQFPRISFVGHPASCMAIRRGGPDRGPRPRSSHDQTLDDLVEAATSTLPYLRLCAFVTPDGYLCNEGQGEKGRSPDKGPRPTRCRRDGRAGDGTCADLESVRTMVRALHPQPDLICVLNKGDPFPVPRLDVPVPRQV